MKFCGYCGKQLEDNAGFCFACGKEVLPDLSDVTETLRTEETACLDTCYRFFKYERLAWKICGIVFPILSALMVVLGVLLLMLEPLMGSYYMTEDLVEMGITYIIEAIVVYFPIAIINLSMIKRAQYYMDTVYTDPAGAVKRAGSVGMIVLGVLFNTIAMIFIIINFAHVKNNKAVFDRIIARQQADHGSETV